MQEAVPKDKDKDKRNLCRKLFQRTLTASAPGSTDSDAEEEVRENELIRLKKICFLYENGQIDIDEIGQIEIDKDGEKKYNRNIEQHGSTDSET